MKSTNYKFEKLLNPTILLILCSLACQQFTYAQNVLTVDNRPESGAQYDNVQDAIAAASSGDIIYIHPSPTSYGSITLDKTLTLVGPGHDPSNSEGLRATLGAITLDANTLNTEIRGLNISSISAYSNGTNAANVHIINNRITTSVRGYYFAGSTNNWVIEGNYFDDSYSSIVIYCANMSDLQIRNNIILGRITDPNRTTIVTNNLFIQEDTTGDSMVFSNVGDITSPIVTNNMFVFTDPDITALTNSGSTPVTYTNCLTWKEAGGVALAALSGSGNLDNTNPLFNNIPTTVSDFYNNDYTLGSGSPAIGVGTDGGEIGIFGRGFPFDIHGRPISMPYPTAMTILNTVVQPGQTLSVDFQASQKN